MGNNMNLYKVPTQQTTTINLTRIHKYNNMHLKDGVPVSKTLPQFFFNHKYLPLKEQYFKL